ncbi:hypothetical protein F3D3_4081 [Fusibacter sp. 3D3]|nr:hypothetical protein F3D3_4081 [Fusibacter sp. 3D3]
MFQSNLIIFCENDSLQEVAITSQGKLALLKHDYIAFAP